jgi:polysaccharide export outer membrane protein
MFNDFAKQTPSRKKQRSRTASLLAASVAFAAGAFAQVTAPQLQSLQRPTVNVSPASAAAASALHTGGATVAPEDVSTMKLMPGSMVDLHVFEEPDLDGSYRLDQKGDISLPLAGTVKLEALTLTEAQAAIQARLVSSQVLKVANVDVNLDEYSAKKITVLGEVISPGSFPVIGPRALGDVLALAGGETALAGSDIVVQRSGSPADSSEPIHYNREGRDSTPLHSMINPGDSVLVKRAGVVYVLGAVTRPGGYLMQEAGELNVDQALALAMGTAVEAKVQAISVFRKMPDGSLVDIHVDYRKINSGKATALSLKPEDVVYVPPSSIKTALVRGTQVLASAASATIYTLY